MKKIILLFSFAAAVWSCSDNKSEQKPETSVTPAAEKKEEPAPDLSTNPDYKKGLSLVANSDCFTCHKPTEKHVGPAYAEVAKKYAGQAEMIDTLAGRIIKGSVGHWGQVPMTAHPNLSLDDARAMVKYVMTLNQ